jgi:hypothetical protein
MNLIFSSQKLLSIKSQNDEGLGVGGEVTPHGGGGGLP